MPWWEGWPKKLRPGVMPRIRRRGPGAQEGKGFHNAKAFPKDTPALAFRCKCRDDVDTWLVRSESRISFGTSSMTIAFSKPLDLKGSVVAVLLPTA